MDEHHRNAILARRAAFLSAALSSVGASAQPSAVVVVTDVALEAGCEGEEADLEKLLREAEQHIRDRGFVEARGIYSTLLGCHRESLDDPDSIAARRAKLDEVVARVTLLIPNPNAVLFVDGREVVLPPNLERVQLELNPGPHELVFELPGEQGAGLGGRWRARADLDPGDNQTVIEPGPEGPSVCLSIVEPPPHPCLSPPPPPPPTREGIFRPGLELAPLSWFPIAKPKDRDGVLPFGGGARLFGDYGVSESLACRFGGIALVGSSGQGALVPLGGFVSLHWLPGSLRFGLGVSGGYALGPEPKTDHLAPAVGPFVAPEVTIFGFSAGENATVETRITLPFGRRSSESRETFGLNAISAGFWLGWVFGSTDPDWNDVAQRSPRL